MEAEPVILNPTLTRDNVRLLSRNDRDDFEGVHEVTPAEILNATHIKSSRTAAYGRENPPEPIFKDGQSIGTHWANALREVAGVDDPSMQVLTNWNAQLEQIELIFPNISQAQTDAVTAAKAPGGAIETLQNTSIQFDVKQRYDRWEPSPGKFQPGSLIISAPFDKTRTLGHYLYHSLLKKEIDKATPQGGVAPGEKELAEITRRAEETVTQKLFGAVPAEKSVGIGA